ncbi:3',5'-cyclic adenosine monophosphate phosphodiesterase CpdA [Roseovarius gaetbuli]|uniref:3',5'-cyclic adenosine monophosphate phosphodiesterase CpdA n=1 Tax=Roseovarius gaetbuli TaxID=1356575 RepID=A0A1X6YHK2_9RHOB|nr:metallophosphoesterase [Roseovarius gaetbuli]SLN20860.1 3',5'-cyclic adenosine monophosphate phosphodiesterase CpdA [Roseovarius gaetbuli]
MTRILQLSDTHVTVPPHRVSGELETFALLGSAITRILADLDGLGPIDAVVVTGDLTDLGDAESYHLLRRQVERLGLPWFAIPGNHDLRAPMRAALADLDYLPAEGRLNWIRDFDDLRLIGLDTLIEGQGGGTLDGDTLAFLDNALQGRADVPALVALHHPPFASGIAFMDRIALDATAPLAEILGRARSEVRLIAGHVHNTFIGQVGPCIALTSAAISSSFPVDFRANAPVGFTTAPGGYMLHDWRDGFQSTCVSLASGSGPHPF